MDEPRRTLAPTTRAYALAVVALAALSAPALAHADDPPAPGAQSPQSDEAPPAQEPEAAAAVASDPNFPLGFVRIFGGFGALLSGGAVRAPGEAPGLGAHVRVFSEPLAIDFGARPFLGGVVIALSFRFGLSTDLEVVAGKALLTLEYDFANLVDSRPTRDFALALGGSLGMSLDYSRFSGTDPTRDPSYLLLHPEWHLHVESRIRVVDQNFFLIRAEMATGFDDLTHVTQVMLYTGYQFGW